MADLLVVGLEVAAVPGWLGWALGAGVAVSVGAVGWLWATRARPDTGCACGTHQDGRRG